MSEYTRQDDHLEREDVGPETEMPRTTSGACVGCGFEPCACEDMAVELSGAPRSPREPVEMHVAPRGRPAKPDPLDEPITSKPVLTIREQLIHDVMRLEAKLEVYCAHREGPETVDSDTAWYAIWGVLGLLKRDLGLEQTRECTDADSPYARAELSHGEGE